MPHLLDHVDALRRVQHFIKDARALEPQIHQRKVDIVVAAGAGLQWIAPPLLALQARPHFRQFLARAHALSVAAPVQLLQLVQETGGPFHVARHGPRFHVRDAFPGFGVAREITLVCAFQLHQVARAAVRPQPRIHREHHSLAGVGAHGLDHALGHAGPEGVLARLLVRNDENQVGVGTEIEFAHAEPAQRDHRHLWMARAGVTPRVPQSDPVGRADYAVRQRRGLLQRGEDGRCLQQAFALNAHHLPAVETAQSAAVLERLAFEAWDTADFIQQFRKAQQVVGKVRAVLENVQHTGRQLGVRIQAGEHLRAGHGLLQEMREPLAAAVQAGAGGRRQASAAGAASRRGSGCGEHRLSGYH